MSEKTLCIWVEDGKILIQIKGGSPYSYNDSEIEELIETAMKNIKQGEGNDNSISNDTTKDATGAF